MKITRFCYLFLMEIYINNPFSSASVPPKRLERIIMHSGYLRNNLGAVPNPKSFGTKVAGGMGLPFKERAHPPSPHPLQQLYKENYLPTEYPGWSKCFYRYYLVRRKCQNTCEWIIRAYFHEESFTYTYNFHENPYFAPESINYVHFWFI